MKIICKYTNLKLIGLFLIALFPINCWAVFSIGDAAQNLMAPTELVTKLLLVSCYVIGLALILGALVQYKIHRQSPKLVPLTTPIMLLILGLISVMIPYGTKMFGPTFSAEGQSNTTTKTNILPLPDASKKPSLLPLPPLQRSTQPLPPPPPEPSQGMSPEYNSASPPPPPPQYRQRAKKPYVAPSDSGDSGHWTSDPRYNR